MSKKPKMVLCRNCNTPIAKNAKICPSCGAKNKKPFFKRWWFVLLIMILILDGIGSISKNKKEKFDWNEVEMETLNWPKSEIAGLLPIPKSSVGKVSADTADGCDIYVEETSIDDFNAYANECSDYGFSVDYERGDRFYNANDENGNKLSLSYQGNHVMVIQIRKPDEAEANESETEQESEHPSVTEQEAEPKEKSSDSAELIDGMRPEFKKAMDSYEEFMNGYCEFMEKYAESDGIDVGLLADYANYMGKYADMAENFEAWDNGEMNTAETAYYLDVQARISKKLLGAGE